jgi:ABC-type arginine transport system permease subunit
MEKGLWFNEGTVSGFLKTEGFLILAVCFLLFAIGHNTKESQSKLDENSNRINLITFTQIVLLTISIASWNQVPFYWIGIIWVGLLLLSIVNNIRKSSCLNFDYPVWVGAFALSHLASTLIFYGSWRFHQPFDLLMLFLAFYGLLKVLQTIWSNYRVFGVLTGLVWLCLIASRFDLI